jgi:hypothetical protein
VAGIFRTFFAFALGIVLSVLALELCFRVLPVNRGLVRVDPPTLWPLENYRPGSRYSYSKDWALKNPHSGRSNNYGHLANFDYAKGQAYVAVIGDSYIEARMNDYQDTLQAQLGELLNAPQRVYGLGANGLSMADYLVLSRLAADEFTPKAFVYALVDNDLSEAVVPRKGWHHFAGDMAWPRYVLEREGGRTRLNDLLAESSLYRYLKGNLGFSVDKLFAASAQTGSPEPSGRDDREPEVRRAIDRFLQVLPEVTHLPPQCHVFLLDGDRYKLYDAKRAELPVDSVGLRQYFLERARAAGYPVVDLGPLFAAEYARSGMKLDYHPDDRHWNRHGHGVAARAAEQALASKAGACPGVPTASGAHRVSSEAR